jgi:hypothetical protein
MVRNFDDDSPHRNFFREFKPWHPWSARHELDDGRGHKVYEYPGVYLLAHFADRQSEGPVDYLSREIVYVGEGSWLRRRWEQFETSARYGLPGHSGGHSYRERFNTSRWNELYVAALPIWFGDETLPRSAEDWTQMYRLYVERRILWQLTVSRGGTHGLLNRK